MDPVPPPRRTWNSWNYIAYWISDATNAANWQLASSMLAVGLSWRQALGAIAAGHLIIAVSILSFVQADVLNIAEGRYSTQRNNRCKTSYWIPRA
jgi:cytosine/uracil/thiamine/allantoin permease